MALLEFDDNLQTSTLSLREPVETSSKIREILRRNEEVIRVVLHPLGNLLLALTDDGVASLFDAETGEKRWDVGGRDNPVRSAFFHEESECVVALHADGMVRLWPLDPPARAEAIGVRELSLAERMQYELLDEVRIRFLDRVDQLYEEWFDPEVVAGKLACESFTAKEQELARGFLEARMADLKFRYNDPVRLHSLALSICFRQGSSPEEIMRAERAARVALQRKPGDKNSILALAMVLHRQGRAREVADYLQPVIEHSPEDLKVYPPFLALVAMALQTLGQHEEAQNYLACYRARMEKEDNHNSELMARLLLEAEETIDGRRSRPSHAESPAVVETPFLQTENFENDTCKPGCTPPSPPWQAWANAEWDRINNRVDDSRGYGSIQSLRMFGSQTHVFEGGYALKLCREARSSRSFFIEFAAYFEDGGTANPLHFKLKVSLCPEPGMPGPGRLILEFRDGWRRRPLL